VAPDRRLPDPRLSLDRGDARTVVLLFVEESIEDFELALAAHDGHTRV
jgi:hypothetical protein